MLTVWHWPQYLQKTVAIKAESTNPRFFDHFRNFVDSKRTELCMQRLGAVVTRAHGDATVLTSHRVGELQAAQKLWNHVKLWMVRSYQYIRIDTSHLPVALVSEKRVCPPCPVDFWRICPGQQWWPSRSHDNLEFKARCVECIETSIDMEYTQSKVFGWGTFHVETHQWGPVLSKRLRQTCWCDMQQTSSSLPHHVPAT